MDDHQAVRPDGTTHLSLSLVDGPAAVVRYRLRAGERLPVAAGDTIKVRTYRSAAGEAIVVATEVGRLIAVVVRDDGLPTGVLPTDLSVGGAFEASQLVYTESRRLANLCQAVLEHHTVFVETRRGVTRAAPGASADVVIDGGNYRLLAFDASRLVDGRCSDADPSHVSWALLKQAQDR